MVTLFSTTLSAANVSSLYSTTPYEIETPYLTADLFDLKYEQTADVLYITHPDYEIRKLSRYANVLWTLTAIDISDGPFRTLFFPFGYHTVAQRRAEVPAELRRYF